MPTYDYECSSCGHTCEVFHFMSDEDPRPCPECGTNFMKKQFGCGYLIIKNGSSSTKKEIQARMERAAELRNRPIQQSHSGSGSGRGKALGGQHIEVDRQEMIKALSKDDFAVHKALEALKKKK